jgi:CTP synthase (UTP-ammonia lyase)
MQHALKLGIVGDYRETSRFHTATEVALHYAADTLGVSIDVTWLPTPTLAPTRSTVQLEQYDALWCAPGSPYASMEGALHAIRFAREQGRSFIGT